MSGDESSVSPRGVLSVTDAHSKTREILTALYFSEYKAVIDAKKRKEPVFLERKCS
jgi:hypothetical protein